MKNISYILYICYLIPMTMSLLVFESKARRTTAYILIGSAVCIVAAELNYYLNNNFAALNDRLYFCTTVSPITEELLKALPVLYYAFVFSDNRRRLMQIAFATGLGFAILENMIIFTQNIDNISISWALIRGFGSGLMHGVCTMTVGIAISFVRKRRKLFYCGTIAAIMLAVTYHAIYNALVMSNYMYFGFALPLVTYVPTILFFIKRRKQSADEEKNKAAKGA